jgi:hypothetical protein
MERSIPSREMPQRVKTYRVLGLSRLYRLHSFHQVGSVQKERSSGYF